MGFEGLRLIGDSIGSADNALHSADVSTGDAMLSSILSSSALLTRALLVVLMLVGAALPAIAAVPKASDGAMTVRNGNTTLGYLRATGDRRAVLAYEIVAQGTKGTASLVVGNRLGVVSYKVKAGVNPVGTDQIAFRVVDSNGRASDTATVTVAFVNNAIVTWPQPTPIIYGTQLSTTATATAGGVPVAGTFVYTPALGTVLEVGTTRSTAVFTPADGGATISKAVNVRVTAATLNVTSNATKIYNAALPTLTPTYSGFVNGDTSATVLTGAPKLTTSATATSAVGTYPITVAKGSLKANKNYTLNYAAGTMSVTPATATVTLSGLASTYDGLGHGAVVTVAPALTYSVTYDGSTLLPVDAGSYAVVATVTNPNYSGSATGTLEIAKANATIQLSDLSRTYNTQAHPIGVTTTPADLATSVTYAGALAAPVNAGWYAVNAIITDPNYHGAASDILVIAKASADVVLSGLAHTYDGTAHVATATTVPADLPLVISYNSGDVAPVNAGTYEVVASILDPNYVGSASDALVVAKAEADITLSGLTYTYDGTAHAVTATTTPPGLDLVITYDNASDLPIAAGSYAVSATINDANRQGSAAGALTIAQAPQTISVSPLIDVTVGTDDQTLIATATSGLPVTLSVTGPAEIIADKLHVTGTGSITVTATQVGNSNWLAAPTVVQTISATGSIGTGLLGSYFANKNLAGTPVFTRVDSLINFDWVNGSPHSSIPADLFSVRWDGEIVPRFNEVYTLTFRTDDGVRIWFDGQLIVNYWSDRSAADSTYSFHAVAGRAYRIRMEYYENGGLAVAKMLWSSASESAGLIPSSQLNPTEPDTSGPIGTGTGLTGSYFTNETLAGVPTVSRIDSQVNFDWAGGSPASTIPADSFSARWTGDIETRYTEPYTLILRTDDGVRMWLDGVLVINDWILRGAANSSYTFNAEAGRRYRIHIEYYEHFGSAVAQLHWFSAREFAGVVPMTQLYPLQPPSVEVAEVGYTIAEREPVALVGTISNANPAALLYAWDTVSGPGVVTFQPTNQAATIARFSQVGTYEIALSAFNGHVVVSDAISVVVQVSDITSELVAHYTFDEGTGSLALDTSGLHHTGTLVGGTWETQGKSGGALRFDGVAQVNVNPASELDVAADQQALTLAVWMKSDRSFVDMTAPWSMPIYKSIYESSQGYGLMVTYTDTNDFGLRVMTGTGFGNRREAAITDPNSGAWVQFTGVYDGSSLDLYRNGVLVNSFPTGAMVVNPATVAPLVLGRGFEGLLDDVRIYRRALSRVDIFGLVQEDHQRRVPTVNAGVDQVASLLSPTITLTGVVSEDDGTFQKQWRQVSGPIAALIANANTLTPSVTFHAPGDYRFELLANDGVVVGRDAVDMSVVSGAVDLSTGLVLHYRLDEASGTLAQDSSVNNLPGTLVGDAAFTTDGHLAGGLNLAGAGKVTTPGATPINNLSQMSLAMWMKPSRTLAAMTTPAALGLYHADFATNRGYGFMAVTVDSNLFGLRLHTGTTRKEVTCLENSAGRWLHYVGTFDGANMRLYRNGEQVNINRTGAFTVPALNVPLRVGEGFEGTFDDVRIYNRALNPTEVRALHLIPPATSNG